MVITRKLKYDTPRLTMGGVGISMSKEMKLLGVILDEKLTFNHHFAGVCKKAIAVYHQLQRAAKISWGLHPEVIRVIYTATVEPIILNTVSVRAPAVKKVRDSKAIERCSARFCSKAMQVGAALSTWKGAAETKTFKLTLPSYCTLYQSELLAICKATREVVKLKATRIGMRTATPWQHYKKSLT